LQQLPQILQQVAHLAQQLPHVLQQASAGQNPYTQQFGSFGGGGGFGQPWQTPYMSSMGAGGFGRPFSYGAGAYGSSPFA
jgi:hypothetical protein